jgi:gamma-glutamyltranspeptidase/glutathione hydrolase
MAPTLVFDKASGQLLMSGGSPGGALIIHYGQDAVRRAQWGLTPQQAINLPNFGSLNGPAAGRKALPPPRWSPAPRGAEVRR